MTTIAADHRALTMVSDSKCTYGDLWSPMTKIHRHGDELIGFAGDVRAALAWQRWYQGGRKGRKPLGPFDVLILRPSGLYHVSGTDGLEMLNEQGYYAIGSGAMAALALLIAGHTAREAVETACKVCAHSGGDIQEQALHHHAETPR